MLLSIVAVVLPECENLQILRGKIKSILSFLEGKRALLNNIFLGILASVFYVYWGMVGFKVHKKR